SPSAAPDNFLVPANVVSVNRPSGSISPPQLKRGSVAWTNSTLPSVKGWPLAFNTTLPCTSCVGNVSGSPRPQPDHSTPATASSPATLRRIVLPSPASGPLPCSPIRAERRAVARVAGRRPGGGADPGAEEADAAVTEADVDAGGVRRLGHGGVTAADPVGHDLELDAGRVAGAA